MASAFTKILGVLDDVKIKSTASVADDLAKVEASLKAMSKQLPNDLGKPLAGLDTAATSSINDFVSSFSDIVTKGADNFVRGPGDEFFASVNVEGKLVSVAEIVDDIKMARLTRFSKALESLSGVALPPNVVDALETLIARHYPLGPVLERQRFIRELLNMDSMKPLLVMSPPLDAVELNRLISNNTANVANLFQNVTEHMIKIGRMSRYETKRFTFNGVQTTLTVMLGLGVTAFVIYESHEGAVQASGLMKLSSCGDGNLLQSCRIQYGSCEAPTTVSDKACRSVPSDVFRSNLCTVPPWPSPDQDEPVGTPGYTCRHWDTNADPRKLQYLSKEASEKMLAECDGRVDASKMAVLSCLPQPTLASYFADAFSKLPKAIFEDLSGAAFDIFLVLKYASIVVAIAVAFIVGGSIVRFVYRSRALVNGNTNDTDDDNTSQQLNDNVEDNVSVSRASLSSAATLSRHSK